MGERNVTITPGTKMAGLPCHSGKLGADWAMGRGLSFGADMQIVSSRGVQGTEDGLLEDGASEIHRLRVPGHSLLHLRAQWRATPPLTVVARVQNTLDRRNETYGALAETVFDAQGRFTGDEEDALFVAPAKPRSLWLGLRLKF